MGTKLLAGLHVIVWVVGAQIFSRDIVAVFFFIKLKYVNKNQKVRKKIYLQRELWLV